MQKILLTFILVLSFISFSSVYAEDAAKTFTLTSTGFLADGALPTLYTCDGKDISPELDWTNPPPGTKTFAVIFSDPDAPKEVFYHWVVYNIPAKAATLAEGISDFSGGTVVGKNTFDKLKYNGPCPPKDSAHNYVFRLYALNSKLKIPAGSDAKTVLDEMKDHIIGKPAELNAVYMRWIK